MSRQPDQGFDPRIADWLEADPVQAPPEVMRTVESAIPSIPQRRVVRLPWRTLPMHRYVLVAATVILVGALGVGVVAIGGRPPAPEATAPPAPASPTPAPSDDPGDRTAYTRAHDAVCQAAVAAKEQLAPRYSRVTAAGASAAEIADGIEAFNDMATLAGTTANELLAIEAPRDIVVDHVQHATRLQDIGLLIRREVLLLRAGKFEEGLAIDEATNELARRSEAFELEYNLTPCP